VLAAIIKDSPPSWRESTSTLTSTSHRLGFLGHKGAAPLPLGASDWIGSSRRGF
jgi:hypothetical protein